MHLNLYLELISRKTQTKASKEVKEESEKVGLKLNIHKTKIKASGLITSWEADGKTMETVTDFIFLGSKITADGGQSIGASASTLVLPMNIQN